MENTTHLPTEILINELQSYGARLVDPKPDMKAAAVVPDLPTTRR